MRKQRNLLLVLGLSSIVTLMLFGSIKAGALGYFGPDRGGEFGTALADYTLSNTTNVTGATTMSIPIYFPSNPGGADINISIDSGAGCIQVDSSVFTLRNNDGKANVVTSGNKNNHCYSNGAITPTLRGFTKDSASGLFVATLYIHLQGGLSDSPLNNVNFNVQLRDRSGTIGYSKGNSYKFAVANTQRCDQNGNHSGCARYYDYHLPFAPTCDQTFGGGETRTITIYDADNGFNPAGNTQYNTQPTNVSGGTDVTTGKPFSDKFVPSILDVTNAAPDGSGATAVHFTSSGTMSGTNKLYLMTFNPTKAHKYQLFIHGIYSNNVLQFQLPFDSIYSQIPCHWSAAGTSAMYATDDRSGRCDAENHQKLENGVDATSYGLGNPYQLQVDPTGGDQHICFFNKVTADSDNTEEANFDYGVRYSTFVPDGHGGGVWRAATDRATGGPTVSPRTGNTGSPVIGGCSWPNKKGWTRPILATNSAYGDNGGTADCNNPDNLSASLDKGGSTDNGYSWQWVNVPPDTPVGTKFCEWITFDPDDGPDNDPHGHSQAVCFEVVPPTVVPVCNDLGDDFVNMEAGQPHKFTITVKQHKSFYPSGNGSKLNIIDFTGPSVNKSGSVSHPDATHYQSATYTLGPGNYAVNYTINDSGGNSIPTNPPCHAEFSVGYMPYFTVRGGDAVVGCVEPHADLESWNNDNSSDHPNYTGAGTNLAALATGDILSFITAGHKNFDGGISNVGVPGTSPSALGFANDNNVDDAGGYGGNLGGHLTVPCTSLGNVVPPQDQTPGSIPLPNENKVLSYTSGDVTLGGNTLTSGHRVKMYVDGDVYITSNIQYAAGSLDTLPSFALYATGSIYVAPGVTQLAGTYVSEDEDGVFATCATALGTESTKYGTCGNPLTIYGAVSAVHIHFERSFGSLNAGNGPAESIHYSPQVWLPPASNGLVCANSACKYDLITSLPPIL